MYIGINDNDYLNKINFKKIINNTHIHINY